jgi:PHP family Zn ribbon phosphoesterase
MIQIDCDFHIHSRFSAGTSRTMDLEKISSGAGQKGLNLLATGDALQKTWLEEIESLSFHRGVGRLNECYFILTTEVEDKNRVHHLIIFKDIPSIHDLRRVFSKHSADIDIEGRPHIRLGGREIAKAAHSVDAIVGPSHAFVPWS